MVDTEKLVDVIKSKGVKYFWLAEQIGISYMSLNKKVHGVVEFKASEISKLSALLDLSQEDRNTIFFN